MQYPPATLMMPHPMAPPPPPLPFTPPTFFGYHQPMLPPPPQVKGNAEENKTIWVGDLHYWMDENYLHSCFGHTGEVCISSLLVLKFIVLYWFDVFIWKNGEIVFLFNFESDGHFELALIKLYSDSERGDFSKENLNFLFVCWIMFVLRSSALGRLCKRPRRHFIFLLYALLLELTKVCSSIKCDLFWAVPWN